jgi:hypothetical protein
MNEPGRHDVKGIRQDRKTSASWSHLNMESRKDKLMEWSRMIVAG